MTAFLDTFGVNLQADACQYGFTDKLLAAAIMACVSLKCLAEGIQEFGLSLQLASEAIPASISLKCHAEGIQKSHNGFSSSSWYLIAPAFALIVPREIIRVS